MNVSFYVSSIALILLMFALFIHLLTKYNKNKNKKHQKQIIINDIEHTVDTHVLTLHELVELAKLEFDKTKHYTVLIRRQNTNIEISGNGSVISGIQDGMKFEVYEIPTIKIS